MKSPLNLTFHVVKSLEERGYCILGVDDLEQLFAHARTEAEKLRVLQEFAGATGAQVEVAPQLRSAKLHFAAA